jgi:hypothetical protein
MEEVAMTKTRYALGSLLLAMALSSGPVQAALFDRGNGLIYDDVLDITWLQDVTHARTSGYNSSGLFNWFEALAWADQLVYAGFDDWRLPRVRPIKGPGFDVSNVTTNGSTDFAYNISYPGRVNPFDPPAVSDGFTGNELAHMFYVNLANLASVKVDGTSRGGTAFVDWGIVNVSFIDGDTGDTVAFENLLRNVGVWTSSLVSPSNEGGIGYSFAFLTLNGLNDQAGKDQRFAAWAVRDGDVGPVAVHEPGTWLLLLVGSLASLAFRRRAQRLPA